MILEKEREKVSVPVEQPAETIPYEPAPVGAAPRKMIKCPSKTGINMNKREKRTGEMLTLVIGLAVILLMAGLVARFGVMEQYRRLSEAQSAYGKVHSQLTACQEQLTDYEQVLAEYRSSSLDGMAGSEGKLVTVPRRDVLDLVETLPTGYKDTTRPLSPAQMTEGVSWKLMLLKWMRSGWNCLMTCFSFRFASNE